MIAIPMTYSRDDGRTPTVVSMWAVFTAVLLTVSAAAPSVGQAAGDRYAVIVGGLGGNPSYTETFSGYLRETRRLLIDRAGFDAANVVVLGETSIAEQPFVDDVSNAENVRSHFESLARLVTPGDHVFVILFGHGSYDGSTAKLNIPRRDLSELDYAAMVDKLNAGRVVFVNTSSASGPFVEALSAPDRVVITATASGTERDETVFPRYFIEALGSADADLDKNGGLSMHEVFSYAAQQTAHSFAAAGQLATEHPQMDDNGDGAGSRLDALQAGQEGHLAAVLYMKPPTNLASVSEAARPLLREREALERSIAELKSRKSEMSADDYFAELEDLFVELARVNDRMEAAE